ncbi:MAG: UDP-N-acetylglucosamine 4,6-dehydratase [Enterococcus sp.]|nr:UDP-N-acetylglucosamine 4,6-dehydratase [Enterococcus sp.]
MFIFLGVEIVLYLSRKRKIAILVILDSILVGISAVGSLLFLQPFSAFFEQEYIMLMITYYEVPFVKSK